MNLTESINETLEICNRLPKKYQVAAFGILLEGFMKGLLAIDIPEEKIKVIKSDWKKIPKDF